MTPSARDSQLGSNSASRSHITKLELRSLPPECFSWINACPSTSPGEQQLTVPCVLGERSLLGGGAQEDLPLQEDVKAAVVGHRGRAALNGKPDALDRLVKHFL